MTSAFRRNVARAIFAVGLPLLLTACSSTSKKGAVPDGFLREASRVFGGEKFESMWIPSSGGFGDRAFGLAALVNPTSTGEELAEKFRNAAFRKVNVAVSGPNSKKVRSVIENAVDLQTTQVPQLNFLFVGSPAERDKVRDLIWKAGGAFYFVPFAAVPGLEESATEEVPAKPEPVTVPPANQ